MRAWTYGDAKAMKSLTAKDFMFIAASKPPAILDRPSWLEAAANAIDAPPTASARCTFAIGARSRSSQLHSRSRQPWTTATGRDGFGSATSGGVDAFGAAGSSPSAFSATPPTTRSFAPESSLCNSGNNCHFFLAPALRLRHRFEGAEGMVRLLLAAASLAAFAIPAAPATADHPVGIGIPSGPSPQFRHWRSFDHRSRARRTTMLQSGAAMTFRVRTMTATGGRRAATIGGMTVLTAPIPAGCRSSANAARAIRTGCGGRAAAGTADYCC